MSAGLCIHPVGLNDEERKIFSVTMNVLLAGGYGVRVVEEMSCNTVAVIDVDSEEGRSFYEHTDAQRRVVISGDENHYRADGHIRKPLRVQTLKNILSDLSEQLHSPSEPAEDTRQWHENEQLSNEAVAPEGSLFYALSHTVMTGGLCKVEYGQDCSLVLIHGPTRRLYTSLSQAELYNAISQSRGKISHATLDEFSFMKQAQGLGSYRIERLIWRAERQGATGLKPAAANRQGRFHLTGWPLFDVKNVKPEYLSLSAILTRRSCGFDELSQLVGVPVGTVFDFYHAAGACGVVETDLQCEDTAAAPPAGVPSLVLRVARKLGLKFF